MLPRRAALIATATLAAVALGAVAERASARVVQTIGTTGPHPLRFPSQVALGPSGEVYVMDRGDRDLDPVYVTVYSPSGAELRRGRVGTNGAGDAHAMLADSAGNVYFGAVSSHLVLKYSAAGRLLAR